jgi:hypothetical protein
MIDIRRCGACAEVAEKTVSYAFSPVFCQKSKSLSTNGLMDCEKLKKGGPQKTQAYPTMCMKTKGKKIGLQNVYRNL